MNKPKVLFLIDTLEIGGAEKSLMLLCTKFNEIQPVICVVYKGTTLLKLFNGVDVEVISLDINGRYSFSSAIKKIERYIDEVKINLIVSSLFRSDLIARIISLRKGTPVISMLVSDSYSDERRKNMSFFRKLKLMVIQSIDFLTSKIPVHFISNSESIKISNSKKLGIPLQKITTIYRGRVISNELKSDRNGYTFLNVGRLIPSKGQADLVKAFKEVVSEYPNSKLVIAGDGIEFNALQKLINDLKLSNNVELLGFQEDVNSLYLKYDCLISNSYVEGFSGVLIEAMLAKMPLLVSDIPMNLEAVNHLKTGYVFQTGNLEEIRASMVWFLNNRNLAKNYAESAFEMAKNKFSLESVVKMHETLYLKYLI